MLVGRDEEIRKLIRNLEQGIHTLVFGSEGTGKSALLQEVASRELSTRVIYVGNCSSRRILLQDAVTRMTAKPTGPALLRDTPIKDLRDQLFRMGRREKSCLMLDHLPRLRHRMQHLLEMLEQHFTLICAVRAVANAYDLYYWKFARLEVSNLSEAASRSWIERGLAQMGCSGSLARAITLEVQRMCRGNPKLISDTLKMMHASGVPLDDPIRVRRFFIDGLLSHLKKDQTRVER
jgi:hypothetical protein